MESVKTNISIVLAGAAGKGVQTVEGILLAVLKQEHVCNMLLIFLIR